MLKFEKTIYLAYDVCYPVCEYAGRIVAGLGGGGGPIKDGTGKSGSRIASEVVEVKDLRLRRKDNSSSTS